MLRGFEHERRQLLLLLCDTERKGYPSTPATASGQSAA
jgi:hypothetical protein